jgi:electron transport complex protein RnfC
VSGGVRQIGEIDAVTGAPGASVTIASDGKQTLCEDLRPSVITGTEDFLRAVRDSGIVGLGGAGFPTGVKLNTGDKPLDYVIINGAECEPYITSDTRTMVGDRKYLWDGVRLLREYLSPGEIVIAIESNKPEPLRLMREAAAREPIACVTALPSKYPQGGEKVLIYGVTGRVVPEGKLPLDVGVIVINCSTLAAVARYVDTGLPLVSKCVTVDGSAVVSPKNVVAPIGTPLSALFDFCGGLKDAGKIIIGGPMMGIAVPTADMCVTKTTNAVIALTRADAALPAESACINCCRCVSACPLRLMPVNIRRAYDLGKTDELKALKTGLCMECGCCAYACPAKIPLTQYMKLAKASLRGAV